MVGGLTPFGAGAPPGRSTLESAGSAVATPRAFSAAPGAPPPPDPSMKRTMVGTGVPFGAASGQPPTAGMAPASEAAPPGMGPPSAPDRGRTLLAEAPPPTQPSPAHEAAARLPAHKSTMVGVALPGIAPTRSAPPPPPTAASAVAQPIRVEVPRSSQARPPTFAPRVSKNAWILISAACALVLVGGLFALFWEPPRPITARLGVAASGSEQLDLACEDCPDGTVVKRGTGSATFTGGRAALALTEALPVGTSRIDVSVERPGMGRDEKLVLEVPVAYRARADFTALAADPPKLRIALEAVPGAAVVVDGRALALDGEGRGHHEIDVTADLHGPKDAVVPLERTVPYAVKTPDGAAHEGAVTARIGITPLRVDAPGAQIVIAAEHFMLTGRTASDGVLTVAGRPITVDTAGRFSQLMNVSSVGQTTLVVRATAPGHAPRTVKLTVKRVASLAEEADVFRQDASSDYSQYAAGAANEGARVVIRGRVVESRVDNHTTLAVVEVREGCASEPCLARVVHGAKLALERDQDIDAFGRIARLVEGPMSHQRIPEVHADFVLTGGHGKKR
jgi:hypothetical protein